MSFLRATNTSRFRRRSAPCLLQHQWPHLRCPLPWHKIRLSRWSVWLYLKALPDCSIEWNCLALPQVSMFPWETTDEDKSHLPHLCLWRSLCALKMNKETNSCLHLRRDRIALALPCWFSVLAERRCTRKGHQFPHPLPNRQREKVLRSSNMHQLAQRWSKKHSS